MPVWLFASLLPIFITRPLIESAYTAGMRIPCSNCQCHGRTDSLTPDMRHQIISNSYLLFPAGQPHVELRYVLAQSLWARSSTSQSPTSTAPCQISQLPYRVDGSHPSLNTRVPRYHLTRTKSSLKKPDRARGLKSGAPIASSWGTGCDRLCDRSPNVFRIDV